MHPEIFGLIKSYGLLLSLSFAIGIWLAVRRGRARGLAADTVLDICFGVLVCSLIGVRFFYVITHWGDFHPWYRLFAIWDGGLTLYGGIIFSIATVWYMARRRRVPFLLLADVLAPSVVLGIGITRIGCFLSGCCYGKPTSGPFGVIFPADCPAGAHFGRQAIHPSQLYSSAAGFIVFILLLAAERWRSPTGATFARFLIFYGAARFLLDLTRFYEPQMILPLQLSNMQWLSILSVAGGIWLLLTLRRQAAESDA